MPDIEAANKSLQVNENRPSKAEIRRAIQHLKNGKAAGPDDIPPEAIQDLDRDALRADALRMTGKKAT